MANTERYPGALTVSLPVKGEGEGQGGQSA